MASSSDPPPHACKHPDKHCLENNTLLPNVIKIPTHALCALKQNLRVFCYILPHQLILGILLQIPRQVSQYSVAFHLYHLLKSFVSRRLTKGKGTTKIKTSNIQKTNTEIKTRQQTTIDTNKAARVKGNLCHTHALSPFTTRYKGPS